MDHDFAVNNKLLSLKFFPKLPSSSEIPLPVSFIVFSFALKLIHFELIFVMCDSPQGSLQWCQIVYHYLLKLVSFLYWIVFAQFKKISGEDFL